MQMAPLGLVGVVFGLAIVAAVIAALLVSRRRRSRAVTQPICGKCGYPVQGLPTFTCPECGSDLRQVGIVTSWQARPVGPLARGLLWTLALPVPAYVVTAVLAMTVLPIRITQQQTLSLAGPGSQAYQAVDLQATGSRLNWPAGGASGPAQLDHVSLTLTPLSGPTTKLDVDVTTMAYEYVKPDGRRANQAGGLDASVLADWMAATGIRTEDEQVQAELNELLSLIHNVRGGGFNAPPADVFQSVSTGSAGGVSQGIPEYLIPSFWIVVWLVGLWYFTRRRRSWEQNAA
jgi:hypothetical protein